MTPKQKAKDLFKRFHNMPVLALICVDEIIEIAPKDTEQMKYSDGTYAREYREIPNRYWNEVKKEINKL